MTEAIREGDIPGVQLRRRRFFAQASASTVWRWLTEPARLRRWLADEAEVAPGAGGGIRLVSGGPQAPVHELGETVLLEPPHRWILSFRRREWKVATRLELEITSGENGSELSVLQQGFEQLPLSEGLTLWEAYRRAWTESLDRLELALAEGLPAAGQ